MTTMLETALEEYGLSRDVPPSLEQWQQLLARFQQHCQITEHRYKAILDNISDAVFIYSMDLHIVAANQKAAQLLHYDKSDDLIGKHAKAHLSEDAYNDALKHLKRLLQGEDVPAYERILTTPDGARVYTKVKLSLIQDEAGKPIYLQSVVCDETELRQAEIALSEKQHHLQTILTGAPMILFAYDRDGTITLSEGHGLQRLGRSSGEAVGVSVYDLYRDTPLVLDATHRALEGEAVDTQVELNGNLFDVRYRPLWENDEVVGLVGIAFDISELSRARQALEESRQHGQRTREFVEAILNNSSDGIVVLDLEGSIQQTNQAFDRLFELAPDSRFGKRLKTLFFTTEYESIDQSIQYVLKNRSSIRLEVRAQILKAANDQLLRSTLVRKSFYADVLFSPIITGQSELTGIVCSVRDISLYKDMAESLERARDEALESSRLKSEFLATMSHEIRTPLNAITGMTTLLVDTNLSAEQHEFVETISQQSDVLLHHINEILDFSKIEAKKMLLDKHNFNLRDLVKNIVNSLSLEAEQKNLPIITNIADTVPVYIQADSHRLRQVLTNLLSNAIKFTHRGSVTLAIRTLSQTANEVRLLFSVTDTGIGISPDMQKKLFQPFVQADGSHSRRYGGTGLGLAIAQGIVELMGSKITLHSELNQGTKLEFQVTFTYLNHA